MKQLLIIIGILMLTGCARTVYVPQVRSERIIDTITRVEPDSAMLTALFECDSLGRVYLKELSEHKGREAQQDVVFKDGELNVETRWKTQYIDRFHEVRDTVTVVDVRKEIQEMRHIPQFFWWCFAIALLSVLYCAWRVVRR